MPAWPVVFSVLKSRWLHYGLLALACALLWARGSHYRDDRDQWKLAFSNQKAAYEAAQEAAKVKAIAAKLVAENKSRADTERNDDELEKLRDDWRAATDRYARLMRSQASGGASSGPATPAEDHGPEGPERARETAILVGRDDLDILVENTIRLKAAYDWAKTLNVEPVPDPAFGK